MVDDATRVPGGKALVIVDRSTGSSVYVGLAVVVALSVAAIAAALGPSVVLAGILVMFAVVIGVFAVPRAIEATKWHSAELHLTQSPLGLGSHTTVEYVRMARRNTRINTPESIEITLRCTETATYNVGTDSRTDTQTVVERTSRVDGVFESGTYRARFILEIPVDGGAPTLDLTNNEIDWSLRIEGAGNMLPKRGIIFALLVQPVLVVPEAITRHIQDA